MSRREDSYDEYISAASSLGFQRLLRIPRPQTGCELVIMAHRDGILLSVESTTSWDDKFIVNSSDAYFYCTVPFSSENKVTWGTRGTRDNEISVESFSAREAKVFLNRMNILRTEGKFMKPWPNKVFVWLLAYEEGFMPNHNEINTQRVAQLPQWVRDFVKML